MMIRSLLHDATLRWLRFDESSRTAAFAIRCLRADHSDGPLDDLVEIHLRSVTQVAAYYDAMNPEELLVEIPDHELLHLEDLASISFANINFDAHFDSINEQLTMETSVQVDWLLGQNDARDPVQNEHTVFLTLLPRNGQIQRSLFFLCDHVEIMSAGLPLSIDEWTCQCTGWWSGWREHWNTKEVSCSEGSESEAYDQAIPVADEEPAEEGYRPPVRLAFDLDVPPAAVELLEPVRDLHEGVLSRDWDRVALAWLSLDDEPDERAQQFELLFGSGPWTFLRQLDDFWVDGPRAHVRLRGVEFVAPGDDRPAEAKETVVSYSLRRYRGRWVIRTSRQNWPETTEPAPPWLAGLRDLA